MTLHAHRDPTSLTQYAKKPAEATLDEGTAAGRAAPVEAERASTARAHASGNPQFAGKPRVLIVDKSPVVRAGLDDYIRKDGRFDVLGAVATGLEFASLAQAKNADIGVAGWALPDMSGGALLAMLKRRQIGTRIVVYTGDTGNDVLREAIREGAWSFISKSEDPVVLIEAMASVARGRLSLPYIDMRTLNADPLDGLTSRERELLAALANGWTNQQIAARTGISGNTVKYHLKNLYDKLCVNNRAMAVAMFVARERDQK